MFLFFGYITCVPEIQEFCTFAFIGLVVDFYMQVIFLNKLFIKKCILISYFSMRHV